MYTGRTCTIMVRLPARDAFFTRCDGCTGFAECAWFSRRSYTLSSQLCLNLPLLEFGRVGAVWACRCNLYLRAHFCTCTAIVMGAYANNGSTTTERIYDFSQARATLYTLFNRDTLTFIKIGILPCIVVYSLHHTSSLS